jgi:tRNA-dihydrouridine synthase
LLRTPGKLFALLTAMRKVVQGSLSVKCRSGYADGQQLFDLLPLFEESGIDFLILHPRTVEQKYAGTADHGLSAEAVKRTRLPIIANGDINTVATAQKLLTDGGVSGLMIGRGALADPLIFRKIHLLSTDKVEEQQHRAELAEFIFDLIPRYLARFCGERQTLMKLKDILNFIPDDCLQRDLGKLKRAVSINRFEELLTKYFLMV